MELTLVMASRAGAEHVYAIEASGLAKKAEENVKRNGCTNITYETCEDRADSV